jgi:chromodomain-helicase-DNA-binding protein 4
VCPHIKSETMVRLMLEMLRQSPEPRELVEAAAKYLKGVKGHLVASKRKARELMEARAAAAAGLPGQAVPGTSQQPGAFGQQPPGVEERLLQEWNRVGPLMQ